MLFWPEVQSDSSPSGLGGLWCSHSAFFVCLAFFILTSAQLLAPPPTDSWKYRAMIDGCGISMSDASSEIRPNYDLTPLLLVLRARWKQLYRSNIGAQTDKQLSVVPFYPLSAIVDSTDSP